MSHRPRLVISPRINERGRLESESLVTPHKLEGGKRKGRNMKRKRIRRKASTVTQENLVTGRENNGYYDSVLKCVVYRREGIMNRLVESG
jgi:hypothetical protein